MGRSVTSIVFVVLIVLVISAGGVLLSTVPAKTKADRAVDSSSISHPQIAAHISFWQNRSTDVILSLTNRGKEQIAIADEGHYIDNIGSPDSWACSTEKTTIEPGETKTVSYKIEVPADHGNNSILVFYFQHQGRWYLGKSGINNGTEYYLAHN